MVVVVFVGVVAGYLWGGRLSSLAEVRLHLTWLLLPAVGAALVAHFFEGTGAVPVLVAGALLLAFLVVNGVRQHDGVRAGLLLMSAGWLLNMVVIAANGGMPTPAEVLQGPTWWPNIWIMPHLLEHTTMGGGTRLPWLADSIELRFAHMLMPVSIGDILLHAGGATFICAAMRRRRVGRSIQAA